MARYLVEVCNFYQICRKHSACFTVVVKPKAYLTFRESRSSKYQDRTYLKTKNPTGTLYHVN